MTGLLRDAAEYKRDAVRATILLMLVLLCATAVGPFLTSTSSKEQSIGRAMVSEAQQWYDISTQDQNLQIKAQHVAFAHAYLQAARHVADDASLERLTKIDIHALHKSIEARQKSVSKDVARRCPKLKDLPVAPAKLT